MQAGLLREELDGIEETHREVEATHRKTGIFFEGCEETGTNSYSFD
jgi:hypothetical protein